jgi:hypothetical protein
VYSGRKTRPLPKKTYPQSPYLTSLDEEGQGHRDHWGAGICGSTVTVFSFMKIRFNENSQTTSPPCFETLLRRESNTNEVLYRGTCVVGGMVATKVENPHAASAESH